MIDPVDTRFDKWDLRFMHMAKECVADWSKDPAEGVGALLVSPDRRHVSWGYNGFPSGIADTAARLGDPTKKRRLTIHAELNALLNCPVKPIGWTLYVTKHPCLDCALAIVQSKLKRVVTFYWDETSRWAESSAEAAEMLKEAGVVLDRF